jgi:alkylation response protein AidB-like acyl-CoA dehydrogenase
VAVGIAEGALGELVGLANTGRQQTRAAVPMRDSEIFQYELGRAAAEFKAARAFHYVHVASHWRSVLDGTMRDEESLVEATQSAIWIANACIRVTNTCFVLGGGSSVYNHFPLQRRLRDLHVAGQHQAVHQRHYAEAGRALLNHGWFGMDGSTFSGDK